MKMRETATPDQLMLLGGLSYAQPSERGRPLLRWQDREALIMNTPERHMYTCIVHLTARRGQAEQNTASPLLSVNWPPHSSAVVPSTRTW